MHTQKCKTTKKAGSMFVSILAKREVKRCKEKESEQRGVFASSVWLGWLWIRNIASSKTNACIFHPSVLLLLHRLILGADRNDHPVLSALLILWGGICS